jgi:hypothetical protein
MQQVAQYINGERDYLKLYGDTGPLVYPAAHVYIYRLLYQVTDHGQNIALAQYIFIGLYLATLVLVMQCYRQAKVPPYVFPLLVLSRRLHSIFFLRLFNDCFAVFFLFLAIFCYQRRLWTLGSIAYSFGLGVKMSLLLALPAIGVVLWQGMGRDRALRQAMLMGQLQVCMRRRTMGLRMCSKSNALMVGLAWLSILSAQRTQLRLPSLRVQPPIPVQVDRQLAVCWRGDLPVKALLPRPACCPRWCPARLLIDAVASTR